MSKRLFLFISLSIFSTGCRVTRHSFLFGRFLLSWLSEISLWGWVLDLCVATKWGRFIMGGKKVGRGARWLRALPSAEGGCCGGGAMVVIACSTCLNSSHIHLGPSFTLNCFYKRLRARVCVKILSSICIFTKLSECLKAALSRGPNIISPPQIVLASWLDHNWQLDIDLNGGSALYTHQQLLQMSDCSNLVTHRPIIKHQMFVSFSCSIGASLPSHHNCLIDRALI